MENTPSFKYIIEHFEEELSEWTLKEYTHMIMLLSGLYDPKQVNNQLLLTNFKFIHEFRKGTLKEDDLKSLEHSSKLNSIISNFKDRCLVTKFSF